MSILSFRQEKLLFRQEFGAVRGRPELPNGVLSTLRLAPVGWVSPPRVLNMRVKWLGETKPAASAISVMLNPGVQEHHSRRFPKRIMALHGRQPRFLIPEHPRNIAAENPPVIFRFGDAFSRKEVVPENDISAKRRKKTAGRTPSVKPCGFATSLSEGGSGETGSFAPEPETLPMRKAPSLRGLSPQATGGVCS